MVKWIRRLRVTIESYRRDHAAMELLRATAKAGTQVRLSNKVAAGYWWCYWDETTVQASDPADAILLPTIMQLCSRLGAIPKKYKLSTTYRGYKR